MNRNVWKTIWTVTRIAIMLLIVLVLVWPACVGGGKESSMRTATLNNLKIIGMSLRLYCENSDGRFPPDMSCVATVRAGLTPYTPNGDADPGGYDNFHSLNRESKEFLGNGSLAGKVVAELEDQMRTIVFFDSAPWPNSRRMVSFVDTHVRALEEKTFQSTVANRWLLNPGNTGK